MRALTHMPNAPLIRLSRRPSTQGDETSCIWGHLKQFTTAHEHAHTHAHAEREDDQRPRSRPPRPRTAPSPRRARPQSAAEPNLPMRRSGRQGRGMFDLLTQEFRKGKSRGNLARTPDVAIVISLKLVYIPVDDNVTTPHKSQVASHILILIPTTSERYSASLCWELNTKVDIKGEKGFNQSTFYCSYRNKI